MSDEPQRYAPRTGWFAPSVANLMIDDDGEDAEPKRYAPRTGWFAPSVKNLMSEDTTTTGGDDDE